MINNAKIKLLELVQLSKSFQIFNAYSLLDCSNANYSKEKIHIVSVDLAENNKIPELDLNKINNGFQLKLNGKKFF